MELICLPLFLIIGVLWSWLEKENKSNKQAWETRSSRRESQESERAMGTFIFLDGLSNGWLLPPPEDVFPVDEEEDYHDDDDYHDNERYRYRDDEY